MKTMNIVFVVPHPDDLELWMGGTVLWHIERGDQVFVVYATKGERGTWIHISGKKLGRIRETEAYRSAKIMGIKNIIFLGLEDRNIICDNSNIKLLKEEAIKIQSDIIYAPEYKHSFLPIKDHTNLGLIVQEIYKNKKQCIRLYHSMQPSVFIDISQYETKVRKALRMHEIQNSFKSSPPYLLKIGLVFRIFLIKLWGKMSGHKFAEGFREVF